MRETQEFTWFGNCLRPWGSGFTIWRENYNGEHSLLSNKLSTHFQSAHIAILYAPHFSTLTSLLFIDEHGGSKQPTGHQQAAPSSHPMVVARLKIFNPNLVCGSFDFGGFPNLCQNPHIMQNDLSNQPSMSVVVEMLRGSLGSLKVPPRPLRSSPPRS